MYSEHRVRTKTGIKKVLTDNICVAVNGAS